MIRVFIETEKEETPEYNFVSTILKQCLTKDEFKNVEIICVNGKDNLSNAKIQFEENTLQGGRNVVIFDADDESNGGGFEKRRDSLLEKKEELGIVFDLFLFPNNKDNGCFETLLENLTVPEHQHIMGCFDKFEECLQSKEDDKGAKKYVLPNIKSRYFTYISSMKLSNRKRKNISYKWMFDDKQYWNLEHTSLEPLKAFIKEHCK